MSSVGKPRCVMENGGADGRQTARRAGQDRAPPVPRSVGCSDRSAYGQNRSSGRNFGCSTVYGLYCRMRTMLTRARRCAGPLLLRRQRWRRGDHRRHPSRVVRGPQASSRRQAAQAPFASLVEQLSEPNGEFDTDNLISNEQSYCTWCPRSNRPASRRRLASASAPIRTSLHRPHQARRRVHRRHPARQPAAPPAVQGDFRDPRRTAWNTSAC